VNRPLTGGSEADGTGAGRRHIATHPDGLHLPGDPLAPATVFTHTLWGFATTWMSPDPPPLGLDLSGDQGIETLTSFPHAGLGGAPH
jgi:hypothetical protein